MDAQKLAQILTDHREWVTSGGARGSRATLTRADLYGATLARADLYGATLNGANLTGADLYGANLTGANLYGATLSGANLTGANLTGANLTGANLTGANLYGATNVPDRARLRTQIVPEEGAFRGFKKLDKGYIAVLDVPASAQRSNATGRKCRVSEAVVNRIYHPDHPEQDIPEGQSQRDASFIYRVGATVRPTAPFDENRWNECGSGIHLFITRKEAEEYS